MVFLCLDIIGKRFKKKYMVKHEEDRSSFMNNLFLLIG